MQVYDAEGLVKVTVWLICDTLGQVCGRIAALSGLRQYAHLQAIYATNSDNELLNRSHYLVFSFDF